MNSMPNTLLPPSPEGLTSTRTLARRPGMRFLVAATALLGILTLGNCGDLGSTGDGGSDNLVDDEGGGSAAVGDRVSDGQFTFIVKSVKCGKESIGEGMFKEEAQGEYCLVTMTVKNTGNEPQLMDSSSQYLFIGQRKYSASTDALLAIDESQNFFLEEINPGNSVRGVVVFDIPKGAQPDRLELHDSPFSGGVTVTI